ncbi:MAG: hypothetical protein DCC67_12470 [Planctomycetota bacterium]|nr:MAG: hypothetical protein DCC67_12470 [Planctomycetota bacterium]
MNRTRLLWVLSALVLGPAAECSASIATSGTLYFTRYAGGLNVNKVAFSYDGGSLASSFGLAAPVNITTTPGADGIQFDPNNGHLLIGGQGPAVYRVNPSTGSFTSASTSPAVAFHLEVDPTASFVYASGIPGLLSRVPIGGAFGTAGTPITVAGPGGVITTIIFTPTGKNYYTMSGSGGFGDFGEVSISGTTATLTPLFSSVPAAHGGEYDPLTGSIFLFGSNMVTQVTGIGGTATLAASVTFPGMAFDQGTVDGAGHLFAASNTGHLLFMDYSATGSIVGAGTYADIEFLTSFLDDIAPLVGPGAPPPTPTIPEPATLAVWSLLGLIASAYGAKARWRAPIA